LLAQVDAFHLFHWKNHVKYGRLASAFVIGGLLLSVGTTAFAFIGQSVPAGILGLCTTLFIGLHDAFNFSDKALFFGEIHAEAKSIRDRLRYLTVSDAEFVVVFQDFHELRQRVAKEVPRGKGIGVAGKGGVGA
jgi:hypothetical protein